MKIIICKMNVSNIRVLNKDLDQKLKTNQLKQIDMISFIANNRHYLIINRKSSRLELTNEFSWESVYDLIRTQRVI